MHQDPTSLWTGITRRSCSSLHQDPCIPLDQDHRGIIELLAQDPAAPCTRILPLLAPGSCSWLWPWRGSNNLEAQGALSPPCGTLGVRAVPGKLCQEIWGEMSWEQGAAAGGDSGDPAQLHPGHRWHLESPGDPGTSLPVATGWGFSGQDHPAGRFAWKHGVVTCHGQCPASPEHHPHWTSRTGSGHPWAPFTIPIHLTLHPAAPLGAIHTPQTSSTSNSSSPPSLEAAAVRFTPGEQTQGVFVSLSALHDTLILNLIPHLFANTRGQVLLGKKNEKTKIPQGTWSCSHTAPPAPNWFLKPPARAQPEILPLIPVFPAGICVP